MSQTSEASERRTVTGVARAAGVDRAFLYRHPDLLAMVQDASGAGAGGGASGGRPASCGCSCHAVLAVDLRLLQAELASLRRQLDNLLAETC